jgi:hypothetical protein
MAVRTLYQNPDIKIVILDRMPSIDIPHLISNVEELLDADTTTNRCVLEGIETEYGIVSYLDLELARMLHPNDMLEIPAARSQLLRYAAINRLIKVQRQQQERADDGIASYEELLEKIGANKNRLEIVTKSLYCLQNPRTLRTSTFEKFNVRIWTKENVNVPDIVTM